MKKIRVLIVDDSSVMRKILVRSLHQAGLELETVLEANDGAEALAMAQEAPVDLILSDIHMPTMDGLEFVRLLQSIETTRGTPVLMITTEGSEPRLAQAISYGASGYIRKPFTPDQVREKVTSLLEVRK